MTPSTIDKEVTFAWYSRVLAEMQTDARALAEIGFFNKRMKEYYVSWIDKNAESIRKFLASEL